MSEAKWLACTDPKAMLVFLRDGLRVNRRKSGDRKLRLFAVACCRQFWRLFVDERARRKVETSERYADGLASKQELRAAERQAFEARRGLVMALGAVRHIVGRKSAVIELVPRPKRPQSAWAEAYTATDLPGVTSPTRQRWVKDRRIQAQLLRDIFGNPFRPVKLHPGWRGPNCLALARTVYDKRRFTRLPELADALEQAGCTNADVLKHCRQSGQHVRGCWVLDLLLGKQGPRL